MIDWKAIEKVDWRKVVNRPESPLWQSYSEDGHIVYFKEATGVPWDCRYIAFVDGDIYFSIKKIEGLRDLIREGYGKDKKFFEKFGRRCLYYCERLKKIAVKIAKKNYRYAKFSEIKKDFILFDDAAVRLFAFLVPMPVADSVLSELVRDRIARAAPNETNENIEEYFKILTYPDKENTHTYEELSLLNVANRIQKSKKIRVGNWEDDVEIKREIEKHLMKYKWIGSRHWWLHRPWTAEDLIERLKTLLERNTVEEIKRIKAIRKENQKLSKELIRKLKRSAPADFESVIKTAKKFAWLRTYRTDVLHSSGFTAREMFFRIAELMRIKGNDIMFTGPHEIREFFEKGRSIVNQVIIEERKKGCGTLNVDGEHMIIVGKELERLRKIVKDEESKLHDFVKGACAFKGKIKGAAKIVHNQFELHKVKKGDVLIAAMTFPSFIAAMEKAAAFVTDEGGILCHAAIVSREMRKPCVIGTKIATKVFKDSEMVEVDAVKGVVRKI